MKRRVVVTGIGAVTPLGNTADKTWKGIKIGKCGIDFITLFDTAGFKVKIAAEVKNFDAERYIDKRAAKRMDRFSQFAVAAAKEAYRNAGLEGAEFDRGRFGVIISSGIGGLATIEKEHLKALEKGFDRVSPFFVPMNIANLAAGNVAIELGAKGSCLCVVTACASGTDAVGEALRHIRDGYAEIMIAGGSEAPVTAWDCGLFVHEGAVREQSAASLLNPVRRRAQRLCDGGGGRYSGFGGIRPRAGARRENSRRGCGVRLRLRRLSHHRALPGRSGGGLRDGAGGNGRRDTARTNTVYQRARDFHAAQRLNRNRGNQKGVWQTRGKNRGQLHKIHDRAHAGRKRRG